MTQLRIGIIGYGDFTKVICEYLAPYANIIVSSRRHEMGDAGFGASFAPLAEVLECPVIIPSFPSQFFEEFFSEYGKSIRTDSLVIDVCSVKVRPLGVLERLLPATCQIIGTHPMFGPASIAKNGGTRGLKCVVAPVRTTDEQLNQLEDFLARALGLEVLRRTPDEHDREMAYVQGLSHYIGRVMDGMRIPDSQLATLAYEDLLDMKRIQGQDSWELFMSIMHDNPYAKEVHEAFLTACEQLDQSLFDKA